MNIRKNIRTVLLALNAAALLVSLGLNAEPLSTSFTDDVVMRSNRSVSVGSASFLRASGETSKG